MIKALIHKAINCNKIRFCQEFKKKTLMDKIID
jgi:hypothetical protein